MRFARIITAILIAVPFSVSAETGILNTQETLSKLNLLVIQLEARINQLQAENIVLRNEMVKAGIKIPLSEFSGATLSVPTSLTWVNIPTTSVTQNQNTTASLSVSDPLATVRSQYGTEVAGFISRVTADWEGIRSHYAFPQNARIAWYEFVQTGSSDHVFVDIVVGTGTAGIFDIKILYQFEKSEFKRKLIGIFIYDAKTGRYITRTGANPFGGVPRVFVQDPLFVWGVVPPTTAGTWSTTSVASTGPSKPSNSSIVTLVDITKAYSEKRYLSTISLSNTYLQSNPATQEILNIRYRTFFITGKYQESLDEIARMERLWNIDKQTACNAQVIATYSKNQSLIDRYTALCKR